jgi:hypothetical protein
MGLWHVPQFIWEGGVDEEEEGGNDGKVCATKSDGQQWTGGLGRTFEQILTG